MANILLLGLDDDLASQLKGILTAQQHRVRTSDFGEKIPDANIVFSAGDDPRYREALRQVRAGRRHDLPFIVVTRLPETSRWLDALESGATDYCGAPFEPMQMRWIVDMALLGALNRPRFLD